MNSLDCILLVDADPSSIAYLSSILSPYGEVRVARSADVVGGALAAGAQLRAAVVDLGAPDSWWGLDVIAELKRKHPGIPAVLLGGGHRPSAANRAYLLGVDYLEKPVDRECIDRFLTSQLPLARKLDLRACLWQHRYELSNAHKDILFRAACGEQRDVIAAFRNTSPNTVKRQVVDLLQRTGDESLHAAIERLTREAIDGTRASYTERCMAPSFRRW